jgi:FlaA1/EpsC-like NDP-sugar epimerase
VTATTANTVISTPRRAPRIADTDAALWQGPIVIGTPASIAAVAAQLASVEAGPVPVGCLLVDHPPQGVLDSSEIVGLPILGDLSDLRHIHAEIGLTVAIVSLPASAAPAHARVRTLLRELSIPERFVPTIDDVLAGPAPVVRGQSLASSVDLVELVGRTPYGIDRRAVSKVIEGQKVLITGAGGSIGSELCRIAATFRPSQLILMERSENALFEIDRQIARRFPGLPRKALLHDVVDEGATLRHLVALRPDVVFHAAAHKHVPLMEDHPSHAVVNNLFGTKSIADASLAVGVKRFVMISSDKAVNPTSVMGATKRLAEMYVQAMNSKSAGAPTPTSFTMVRFGNVLGSACSVLPIWSHQLAEGGPVTVTDPRMTRYFMTITEAATLVIQAAAIDAHAPQSPTVLVLDMGEPVAILDLATRFVRLCGFEPRLPGAAASTSAGPVIDITFTGARPGEKLHEELAYSAEALRPTPFPGIMTLAAAAVAPMTVASMIAEMGSLRGSTDRDAVLDALRRHVPEMTGESVQNTNKKTASNIAAA